MTNNIEERIKYFKTILIELYLPVFTGILINLIIKLIIFYSVLDNIKGDISFLVIGTSFIYLAVLSLFMGALNIVAQITLKDKIKAVLFPLFVIDVLIITFSCGAFLLGESIPAIKSFINLIFYPMLKLIDGFFFNFKFELMYFENQLVILLLIAVMTAVSLLFAYKGIRGISKENLKLEFRNEGVRKFIFLMITAIAIAAITIIFSIFISLVVNSITVNNAVIIGEVISVILIPLAYIKINKLYRVKRCEVLSSDYGIIMEIPSKDSEEAVSTFNNFSFERLRGEKLNNFNEPLVFNLETKDEKDRMRNKEKNLSKVKGKNESKIKKSTTSRTKSSKGKKAKNKNNID